MRLALAISCLGLAACHRPAAPIARPPVPDVCASDRVGRVVIDGGTADDVPQLAILEGTLDDAPRTDRIVEVSTDMLRARGYAKASIDIERRIGCGIELAVHVARGPRYTLAHVAFETDDAFPRRARYAVLEDALGTVNAIGGAFVADRLDRALDALAQRYEDAGWLDVDIAKPAIDFDDERGEVSLTIPIHAGPRFKVGTVIARGGRRSTRRAVIEALGLRDGDWYDGRVIRAAIDRARREVDERIELRLQMARGAHAIDLEAVVGDKR